MKNDKANYLLLVRCLACHRLQALPHVLKRGSCSCGYVKITDSSPNSLIEWIKVIWWCLTIEGKYGSPKAE